MAPMGAPFEPDCADWSVTPEAAAAAEFATVPEVDVAPDATVLPADIIDVPPERAGIVASVENEGV